MILIQIHIFLKRAPELLFCKKYIRIQPINNKRKLINNYKQYKNSKKNKGNNQVFQKMSRKHPKDHMIPLESKF